MSGVFVFFTLLTIVVSLMFLYYKKLSKYWKILNVPHTSPKFPFGDFQNGGLSQTMGILFKNLYEKFPNERFFGIWMLFKPVLLVKDPELIKAMFVKDFINFHDRGIYFNEKDDPLSAKLVHMTILTMTDMVTQLKVNDDLTESFKTEVPKTRRWSGSHQPCSRAAFQPF